MASTKPSEDITWNSQSEDGQVLLSMPWEVFVLGVACLSILNMVLAFIIRNPDTDQTIATMDTMLVIVFLSRGVSFAAIVFASATAPRLRRIVLLAMMSISSSGSIWFFGGRCAVDRRGGFGRVDDQHAGAEVELAVFDRSAAVVELHVGVGGPLLGYA